VRRNSSRLSSAFSGVADDGHELSGALRRPQQHRLFLTVFASGAHAVRRARRRASPVLDLRQGPDFVGNTEKEVTLSLSTRLCCGSGLCFLCLSLFLVLRCISELLCAHLPRSFFVFLEGGWGTDLSKYRDDVSGCVGRSAVRN